MDITLCTPLSKPTENHLIVRRTLQTLLTIELKLVITSYQTPNKFYKDKIVLNKIGSHKHLEENTIGNSSQVAQDFARKVINLKMVVKNCNI